MGNPHRLDRRVAMIITAAVRVPHPETVGATPVAVGSSSLACSTNADENIKAISNR
jgi:hypothetical protein